MQIAVRGERTDSFDHVLDASAVLALLNDEPGADVVAPLFPRAMISAVNWSEVLEVLLRRGVGGDLTNELIALGLTIMPFEANQAAVAAGMWQLAQRTRGSGRLLSLGDRACLALAEQTGLPAVTADSAWEDPAVRVEIVLIR